MSISMATGSDQPRIGKEEAAALDRAPVCAEPVSSYHVRPAIWHDVTPSEWASYAWQWEHRILTADMMAQVTPLSEDEKAAINTFASSFSLCVSPHYAALLSLERGDHHPIRRQCIPSMEETAVCPSLLDDPLGEARHQYSQCGTRRYPDRALVYTTHECAMRCRHCTRRCKVGKMAPPTLGDVLRTIDDVCADSRIRDVLLSGGDVLSLPTSSLEGMLARLRACDHIDVIRVCTRMPCTLPQRMHDEELCRVLEKYAPIYVNTQFNHPLEATVESALAMKSLRDAGCILGNQSVLLRGVNEDPLEHEALNRWLLRHGCRPYYLFLCDVAQGTDHFRTPIQTGFEIMSHLRGRLSGLGIPHYVVDLPDGMGKVDLAPGNMHGGKEPHTVLFKNWFGAEVSYPDVL